ncbi:MAG: 50S ribosome-binding GTPase [Eubacteriales bacterium]|nr:50S ribosome-binding GTPase [Eubacteriales bacterium]
MKKENVLLVGISGAGKSTLVNSIAGQKFATIIKGDSGTREICKYESDVLDFNLFDTRGFEYNWFNQRKTLSDMKKLVRKGLREEDDAEASDTIGCVWYCVEASSGKLHKDNIKSLKSIISDMKNVPVIVVLTKSIETTKNEENVEMVKIQFAKYGKGIHVAGIVPVVAEPYMISDDYILAQYGIEELNEKTNEALQIFDTNEAKEKFRKKQRMLKAQMITNVSAASAGVIGAVPLPLPDAAPLGLLETAMISSITSTYGWKKDEKNIGTLIKYLVSVGTVGMVAKSAINMIKAIPGITLGASVINAAVAVSIVELLGQTSIVVFEKIDAGELDVAKLDEIEKFIEGYVNNNMPGVIKIVQGFLKDKDGKVDMKDLISLFSKKKSDK